MDTSTATETATLIENNDMNLNRDILVTYGEEIDERQKLSQHGYANNEILGKENCAVDQSKLSFTPEKGGIRTCEPEVVDVDCHTSSYIMDTTSPASEKDGKDNIESNNDAEANMEKCQLKNLEKIEEKGIIVIGGCFKDLNRESKENVGEKIEIKDNDLVVSLDKSKNQGIKYTREDIYDGNNINVSDDSANNLKYEDVDITQTCLFCEYENSGRVTTPSSIVAIDGKKQRDRSCCDTNSLAFDGSIVEIDQLQCEDNETLSLRTADDFDNDDGVDISVEVFSTTGYTCVDNNEDNRKEKYCDRNEDDNHNKHVSICKSVSSNFRENEVRTGGAISFGIEHIDVMNQFSKYHGKRNNLQYVMEEENRNSLDCVIDRKYEEEFIDLSETYVFQIFADNNFERLNEEGKERCTTYAKFQSETEEKPIHVLMCTEGTTCFDRKCDEDNDSEEEIIQNVEDVGLHEDLKKTPQYLPNTENKTQSTNAEIVSKDLSKSPILLSYIDIKENKRLDNLNKSNNNCHQEIDKAVQFLTEIVSKDRMNIDTNAPIEDQDLPLLSSSLSLPSHELANLCEVTESCIYGNGVGDYRHSREEINSKKRCDQDAKINTKSLSYEEMERCFEIEEQKESQPINLYQSSNAASVLKGTEKLKVFHQSHDNDKTSHERDNDSEVSSDEINKSKKPKHLHDNDGDNTRVAVNLNRELESENDIFPSSPQLLSDLLHAHVTDSGSDLSHTTEPNSKNSSAIFDHMAKTPAIKGNLPTIIPNSIVTDYSRTEDFLMDQLFHACDRGNTGRVRVLDLIEYLGSITGVPLENDETVNALIDLLDPDNVNAEIDMMVYRDGLHRWIRTITENRQTNMSRSDSFKESLSESSIMQGKNTEVLLYQTGDEAEDKNALSHQLVDLHLQNRKLTQDINDAHAVIEARDEELSRVTREMMDQDAKVLKLQTIASVHAKAEEERSELTKHLSACQDNYENCLDKNKQLEQENYLLHVQLSRYKKQVTTLTADLSTCCYEKERLECSILESKEKACHTKQTVTTLEIHLSEKEDAIQDLKISLEQSALKIQDLQQKNKELQSQLVEVQEELASVDNQSYGATGLSLSSLKELRHLIEEDVGQPSVEEEREEIPSSIHNELKEFLSHSNPDRPWPLSEKEIVECVDAGGAEHKTQVSDAGDSTESYGLSSESHKVSQADSGIPQKDTIQYGISNERLRWLVSLMRKLKGENVYFRRMLTQMVVKDKLLREHLGDPQTIMEMWPSLSSDQDLDTPNGKDRETSSSHLRGPHESYVASLCNVNVSSVLEENRRLREEMINLKRYNVDLAEKYHITELQVQSLQEEAHNTNLAVQREKRRNAELEETLGETALSRQLDLRDIWRLVQKDVEVETEHYKDEYDAFDKNSLERLKENIEEGIAELKNEKNTIDSPHTDLPVTPERPQCCQQHNYDVGLFHDRCCCNQLTPTSPLVEALSIDTVNGNFLPCHHFHRSPDNHPGNRFIFHHNQHGRLVAHQPRPTVSNLSPTAPPSCKSCLHSIIPSTHNQCGLGQTSSTNCQHDYPTRNMPDVTVVNTIYNHESNINAVNENYNNHNNQCYVVNHHSISDDCSYSLNINLQTSDTEMSYSRMEQSISSLEEDEEEDLSSSVHSQNHQYKLSPERDEHIMHMNSQTDTLESMSMEDSTESFDSTQLYASDTKPKPSIVFIPIQKEPVTHQKSHGPVRKPLPSNNSVTTDHNFSGFKGVHFSHSNEDVGTEQNVHFVPNKEVDIDHVNSKSGKSNNFQPILSKSYPAPTDDSAQGKRIRVSKSAQFERDEDHTLGSNTRPSSLNWASRTQPTRGRFRSSSSTKHNPSTTTFNLLHPDPLSASSHSREKLQDQMDSAHHRSLESSQTERSFPGVLCTPPQVCSHLFGVPEAMENWDLSPCMGQDTANEEFNSCPSRMVDTGNNEKHASIQIDRLQVEGSQVCHIYDTKSEGMETDQRNGSRRHETHDNVSKISENTQKDANANVSMNTSRNATTSQQLPESSQKTSVTGDIVLFPSILSSQVLQNPGLVCDTSGIPRTINSNLASFTNSANIYKNPMVNSFSSSSQDSSSSSSSSLSSVPSYYFKSDKGSATATSTSKESSQGDISDEKEIDQSNETSQGIHGLATAAPASAESSLNDNSSQEAGPSGATGLVPTANVNESGRPKSPLVPSSPPTTRHAVAAGGHEVQPLTPSRLARIRQNHLAIKRREQMKNRKMKLPEVAESSEHDSSDQGACAIPDQSNDNGNSSQIFVTSDEDVSSQKEKDDEEKNEESDESRVTPNLPDSFLQQLGLLNGNASQDGAVFSSLDQLSEREIESKFVSLSLAFRTDKLTIDQRVSVQERARDLAEQNVDKELQELGEAVEILNQTIIDSDVREIIQRIRCHIHVLEQSAARVSSRAEVYGAVQQERRMCKAIEVMVQYTENLKRARDKEESELQEARKILNERSLGLGGEFGDPSSRRSMSVCGANALGRPMRRRSEVVLPKVLGGIGSPSLTQTASMENVSRIILNEDLENEEDPRSRFQSVVASTSMKNAITNTLKRASLERLNSSASSPPRSSTTLPPPLLQSKSSPATTDGSIDVNRRTSGTCERISESSTESKEGKSDEDAYRKGFEEGLKAQLSQGLSELRDQQASISNSLEDVMDKVDLAHEQDQALLERPSRLRAALTAIKGIIIFLIEYDYWSNKKLIRNIAGVIFVFLAVFAVFLSPPASAVDIKHFSKPPQ